MVVMGVFEWFKSLIFINDYVLMLDYLSMAQ